ncbi:hypothetical protein QBC35DRAFT_245181 [Podospora australis]|uniref:Uncharacterized protein n=1 Tax=Podospora australis TaxID=1536484 RepID=A0AAN6X272_9PEZI|nr:hypothetical protein QBC35DRAFT_245181 [Podospora australis]
MTSPKLKNSVMTKEDDKETTVDIIDENAVPEEVHKLYSFLDSKEFQERMFNCYIYAVRVVAIRTMTSGPAAPVNMFTGPRIRLRHATLLAAGGWIVPPMEERDPLGERGGFKKPPQPPAQRAMPIKLDHTGRKPPKYSGELAPIWDLPADPTLEDVYWMTWQLLSGTTYVGFQTGSGFGKDRDRNGRGDTAMLAQCPFDNPSGESLRYSATPKTDNDAGAGPSKDDGSGSGKDDESGPGKDDGSGPGKDDDSPTISDAELYDA